MSMHPEPIFDVPELTAKVVLAFGVERLAGQPVDLPVTALLAGIGAFRAHLYSAFHSGRTKETLRGRQVLPIARVTLAGLSGVGRPANGPMRNKQN